ncbi:MAG: HAD family hydrolase [Ignavibacteria bacterium]|jgi:HAD superfamily hydrolase (TIGR01549 family)|nr:HAD family hydrolase [Ignavibacteria bacterium]MDH7527291.1 HAD family hydrolase [Ignavibacteria bacterium]
METKKYKGIIFDIDGTLTSTNELIFATFNHIAQKYEGRTYSDEEIISMFGPTEDVILREKFNGDKFKEVFDEYYRFYRENHPRMADLYPGIVDILEELKKRKILISIFTGKGRKTTEITLEILGIKDFFDMIVTGDDVINHKPSPEGIFKFLETYSLNKNEVLMVGDSLADIIAAKEAGIDIASVVWDSYAREEVIKLNPIYFETVNDFKNWLIERI